MARSPWASSSRRSRRRSERRSRSGGLPASSSARRRPEVSDIGAGDGRLTAMYKRVLLKLSGDAFAPPGQDFGIAPETTSHLARQLADVTGDLGVQMAVVVGGGNIWRGRQAPEMG